MSTDTNKLKRKVLTIDTKLQILAEVDKKTMAKKDIAAKYGIPHNSLSTIIKNREKIEQSTLEPQRKKQRLPTNADVDAAVLLWFKQTRAINAPTSGPIIVEQAKIFAEKLGVTNFQASNGWLYGFKKRHGIIFKVACGESASVNTATVDDWRTTALSQLLADYSPQDIFNADETGLFFRCLPNKTHAFKGEACHGGKQAKDRLTVLIACNMTGTEKLPLLVIGKAANPRCFKNVKSLPVDYTSNSKAWMTSAIFENWVRKLDRKFLLQGRSILMVVDNCPSHPMMTDLKAIRLEFLPPNTTSHTQPCDQGIINAFKHRYRSKIVRRYLDYIDDSPSSPSTSNFHISVLDALHTMRWAWGMVSPDIIANCFRHAGFCTAEVTDSDPVVEETKEDTAELSNLFDRLADVDVDPQGYVDIDQDVAISSEVSADAIVEEIKEKDRPAVSDDEDEDEAPPPVTGKEAKMALMALKRFALQHDDGTDLLDVLEKAEDKLFDMVSSTPRQTAIHDYFTVIPKQDD